MNFEEKFNKTEKEDNQSLAVYDQMKEVEPFYVGACLAGLNDSRTWEIRNYLLKNKGIDGRRGVAQGLAGIRDEASYALRRQLLSEAPESTARGLAGDDSEAAWEIREELINNYLEKAGVAEGLAESLANINTARSWKLREKLIPQVLYNVFEGLVGVDDDRAWELRNEHQKDLPLSVANSLIGLNNDKANNLREELADNKLALLISCVGLDDNRTWQLREDLFEDNPFIVGTSLVGINNEKADNFRARLKEKIDQLTQEKGADDQDVKKVRKGLLQGLNSNYIFESLKK